MTPRETLAEADRHRRLEHGAESAMRSIRLGRKPVMRRGLFGFRKRPDEFHELVFGQAETSAIYEALRTVQAEHRAAAGRLEATVTTTDGDRRD